MLNGQRESKTIASLLRFRLKSNVPESIILDELQKSIANTDLTGNFICMYNAEGIQICHPDPSKIGLSLNEDNSIVKVIGHEMDGVSKSLLSLLKSGKIGGGIRSFKENGRMSEIIFVQPVIGSDWIIATHSSISFYYSKMQQLKIALILMNIVSGLILIFVSYLIVRVFGGKYEKFMVKKNNELAKEIMQLSQLNKNLEDQKFYLEIEQKDKSILLQNENLTEPATKRRVLVYWRDQLIPIFVEQISYIYSDFSGNKLMCFDKREYLIGVSLDQIFIQLDQQEFFRANRQYIVSIKAIDVIYKYGNNQLKIEMNPRTSEDVIISKNRVSEFKNWLNG
jgi:DNA-binding LytR/AlgR family response regulator